MSRGGIKPETGALSAGALARPDPIGRLSGRRNPPPERSWGLVGGPACD